MEITPEQLALFAGGFSEMINMFDLNWSTGIAGEDTSMHQVQTLLFQIQLIIYMIYIFISTTFFYNMIKRNLYTLLTIK